MAQCNWTGFSVSATDLTDAGDLLWDTTTEGFQAPVGVKFTNAGAEAIYVSVVGFHYQTDPADESTWNFSLLPVGESLEIVCRHPLRPSGGLTKAYAWSAGGAGTLVWTPTIMLNGRD